MVKRFSSDGGRTCSTITSGGLFIALLSCAFLVSCGQEEETETKRVSLIEWKEAISSTYRVVSSRRTTDGSTESVVCVDDPDGGSCIPARLTLSPFDKVSYFEPMKHASDERAAVFAQVVVLDGRQPNVVIDGSLLGPDFEPENHGTVALVIDGALVVDTSSSSPGDGLNARVFGVGKRWNSARVLSEMMCSSIRGMGSQSVVQAKISGSRVLATQHVVNPRGYVEPVYPEAVDVYLDADGSQALRENIRSMEAINRTLRRAVDGLTVDGGPLGN